MEMPTLFVILYIIKRLVKYPQYTCRFNNIYSIQFVHQLGLSMTQQRVSWKYANKVPSTAGYYTQYESKFVIKKGLCSETSQLPQKSHLFSLSLSLSVRSAKLFFAMNRSRFFDCSRVCCLLLSYHCDWVSQLFVLFEQCGITGWKNDCGAVVAITNKEAVFVDHSLR
jgi:hypothetical protein